MWTAGPAVMSSCYDLPPYNQDRSDRRIGTRKPQSLSRFLKRDIHEASMSNCGWHKGEISVASERGKPSFQTRDLLRVALCNLVAS
jgi:hypothetical protein